MDHVLVDLATRTTAKRRYHFLRFKLQPGDEAFISHLPEEQRALLLAEGTYADKAARFNIPLGTVRSRLHRARAAVARQRNVSRDKVLPDNSSVLN
jgi:hypothetical protein